MAPRIKRYADGPEVREWALELTEAERKRHGIDGLEVSNRGRFHSKIVEAFNRAHRNDGIRYVPIGRSQPRTPDVFEAADKGDSDEPEVYRQERQERREEPQERPTPPTPMPSVSVSSPSTVAPPAVMELLRSGQNVVVVYVPVEMASAV